MSKTIFKSASVKVMLSHNYNHFETSIILENEEGLNTEEINEARKDCMRLCDKAIIQYNQAKHAANKLCGLDEARKTLSIEVDKLRAKDGELTPEEKAKIKTLEDYNWNKQFDYEDGFDDYDSPEDFYSKQLPNGDIDF